MKLTSEEKIRREHAEFIGETEDLHVPENVFCGYENIKATLLAPISKDAYKDWVEAAYAASFETWHEIGKNLVYREDMDFSTKESRLLNLLKTRKISAAMESIKFTFRLENISRAITHQIVRHRKMSFGQQSLRVADPAHSPIRIPEMLIQAEKSDYSHWISDFAISKEDLPRLIYSLKQHYSDSKDLYYLMVRSGIPREQARSVLPIAITTTINMVTDLGALSDYIKARTSEIAQDEHTVVVEAIIEELKTKQPLFYRIISGEI